MNAVSLTVSLLLSLLEGVEAHYGPVRMENLLGREYTEIPSGVCTTASEILFGESSGSEYSGLICTQMPQSFMVLQRLNGYTPDKKVILKAVAIQALPILQKGEISINRGCQAESLASIPIIAIVRDIGKPNYATIRAWKADLAEERFQEINPQEVVCQMPWLSGVTAGS